MSNNHQLPTTIERYTRKDIIASSHGDGSCKILFLEITVRQATPTVRWAVDDHDKPVYRGIYYDQAAEAYNALT